MDGILVFRRNKFPILLLHSLQLLQLIDHALPWLQLGTQHRDLLLVRLDDLLQVIPLLLNCKLYPAHTFVLQLVYKSVNMIQLLLVLRLLKTIVMFFQ